MIEIRRYVSRLLSSNMYVVVEGNHAIVIDPFEDSQAARGLTVDAILLTHEHYDHISGVNVWKEETGAPVLCSKACADNISNPKRNLARHFREFCELQTWMELTEIPDVDTNYSCVADKVFEDKLIFKWEGHELSLFEIPGHSKGSIGIMLDGTDFFSGDSLLENFEIELRMPSGNTKLWKEIGSNRIELIPKGTRVWPGHFDSFIFHGWG